MEDELVDEELDVLLVVVLVVELDVLLELDDEVEVLEVVTTRHALVSISQPSVQVRKPAAAEPPGQAAPPESVPSHASPGSRWPLPHGFIVVLVLVLVDEVVEDELVDDALDVLLELVVVLEVELDELLELDDEVEELEGATWREGVSSSV